MPQLLKYEQINRVERFANENGLNSKLLKADFENVRNNVKWADKYIPIIKDVIQQTSFI